MHDVQTNWAGNYTYSAARWHAPESLEELQELVAGLRALRVVGSRHSFNGIADTPADMVSLARMDRVLALDPARRTVTVEGGIRYGQLGLALHQAGFALHNLASLPHISVAGAVATATHGSGDGNGNLATAVSGLELVTASGELVSLTRDADADAFRGAVVGLGALGVVARLTLDIEPAFEVAQVVYEQMPLAEVLAHFDELTASAYSVSLFTDWLGGTVKQVWLKHRVAEGWPAPIVPALFGAEAVLGERHPLAGVTPENTTPQRGVPGPWHERLPHFRMGFTPSSGAELQTEYFVPRAGAQEALRRMAALGERLRPALMISEVRTVAADDLWLSPCYGQACVGFHFTWRPIWDAVRELLPQIEAALGPLEARPHWGKLFTMPPAQVRSRYARMADFRALQTRLDPHGKLRNPFIDTYIFDAG